MNTPPQDTRPADTSTVPSATLDTVSIVAGLWQDRPGAENLNVAQRAGQLGFTELWMGEMATYDVFALATAVGQLAPGMTLTTGPLAVSVRTPMTIAMGAASVADLTGNPVRVALGTSSPVVADRWHGTPRHRPATMLAESADIVRGLLDGDKVDMVGETVSCRGYRLRLQAPGAHVTIAAFGDLAVRAAARHADRMVLNMVTVDTLARFREQLDREAAAAGNRPPTLAVWVAAAVAPTEETFAQLAAAKVGYYAAPGYGEMFAEAGFGELVELARSGAHPREVLAATPSGVEQAIAMVGDQATVAARLQAYLDAGADEVCVVPATAGDDGAARTLQALAEVVAGTSP